MTTTVASHAQIIRRRLYSGFQGRYNLLATTIDTDDTTIALSDDLNGIVRGGRIAIGSEIMLVRGDPNTTAKTCRVIRGFLGTTPAAHTADDLVEVAPRFPLADIIDTMREEVASWGDNLFAVNSATVSTASNLRGYDLTGATDPLFTLEVTRTNTVGSNWDNSRSPVEHSLFSNLDQSLFPSGFAIQIKRRGWNGEPLVIVWAEPLATDPWRDTTDLINTVGLQASWLDIITYGVLWRLMSTREIGRTDIQAGGEIRRAEENPPGYSAKTADEFQRLRDRRIADEANRLRARYPYRITSS